MIGLPENIFNENVTFIDKAYGLCSKPHKFPSLHVFLE